MLTRNRTQEWLPVTIRRAASDQRREGLTEPTDTNNENDNKLWKGMATRSCEKEILGYYSFDKHGVGRAAEKTNKQKL